MQQFPSDERPFGEELFAGAGIRSASNGYSGDSVRQKYDGYERDSETGLDFAQARYYLNLQGRFTSPDAPLVDQSRFDPQTWNLYAFVRNNPCANTDPSGRETCYFNGNQVLACEGAKKGSYRIDYKNDLIYVKDKNGNEVPYKLDARFVVRGYLGADTLPYMLPNEKQVLGFVGAFGAVSIAGGTGAGIGLYTLGGGAGITTLGLSGTTTTTTAAVVVASEQGAVIGWGTGQSAAAVQQTLQVTANLTRAKVAEMVARGLSKPWVQEQLVKYGASVLAGKDKVNTQLLPRKELMEKILELWPK